MSTAFQTIHHSWVIAVAGALLCLGQVGCYYEQTQKLVAGDGGDGDTFGQRVAIDGDLAVISGIYHTVGANTGQGAVYVYKKNGNSWTAIQELVAPDGAKDDQFGFSLALQGNTLVVGAPLHKVGNNPQQGQAYVFELKANGLFDSTPTQTLKASDGQIDSVFGVSMAIDGNTLAIGAPNLGMNMSGPGAVYVFERKNGSFPATETTKLSPSDGVQGDAFGYAGIGLLDDTLVVGAPFQTINGNAAQGAAYVYRRQPNGNFPNQETQKLYSAQGAANDFFGILVAIDADAIYAAAPYADANGNMDQGIVSAFDRLPNGLFSVTPSQIFEPPNGQVDDNFGTALSIRNNTLAIGAPGTTVKGKSKQGVLYLWRRDNNLIAFPELPFQQLTAADGDVDDQFGAIGLDYEGRTLIVGSPGDDFGGIKDQGSAYVFTLYPPPLSLKTPAKLTSSALSKLMGHP